MAYHNFLLHSDAHSNGADTHTPINVLIRRGLWQAFPLPGLGQAADEKFTLLLEALAPRGVGIRHAATSLTVLPS